MTPSSFLEAHMHEDWGQANSPDAAGFLGKSGDERAFLPLLQALTSGGDYYRATAAIGLGYLGNKEAIPALEQAFLNDPGVYVRCDAALALGMLRSEKSLPTLLERFSEEGFKVQKRIVMAIAKFGWGAAEQALAAIEGMLSNSITPSTPGTTLVNGSREDFCDISFSKLDYKVNQRGWGHLK